MKKNLAGFLSISLLLSAPHHTLADCGQFSIALTNLPYSDTTGYQVNGLNSAGQLTGFFYNDAVPAGHAFVYTAGNLTDAGTLGGDFSQGLAINNSGWIAGQSQLNGDTVSHAMLFTGAAPFDLGSLGGSYSSAAAINDAGQVAGSSTVTNASGDDAGTEAFLYSNGLLTPLGTLGGADSLPAAINSAGMVAGHSSLTNGDLHGFVYANGALTDVGTLGGNYSAAFALNDSRLVAGESTLGSGENHGFVYLAGALTDVGTLGGTYSSAYAINNSNQVAGLASTAGDAQYHGFLYSNGTLTDIGTLGGTYSGPSAMNNLGQIVGEAETASGAIHAFLWNKGTMVDLNSLLPANSNWELDRAIFINDSGRIVGFGAHNGVFDWFILDLTGVNNNPPVALAGPNQTVDCQTQVTLDGSQSSDPEGGALTFEWTSAGYVLGTNSTLQGYFLTGTNIVTLRVTDPCGASASTSVAVIVRDTTPPTISGPGPVTLPASDGCDAAVPDFTSQVTVSDNCTPIQSLVISQNPVAGTHVGLGHHCVIVTAKDLAGNVAACKIVLKVVDVTAPVILAVSGPITNSANANCQGVVPNVLGSVIATDNCTAAGDLVKVQHPAAGTVLNKGQHTITVCVKDASGNKATQTVAFTIADTTAPVIQSVTASPNVISPPNHKMVPVSVSVSASDHCDGSPSNKIISITCNEATSPDEIVITGKLSAKLAATRNGSGGGRIYTITVQSTDNAGNSSTATTTVTVPQGNGKN